MFIFAQVRPHLALFGTGTPLVIEMQSLSKRSTNSPVKIKFKTEKDRTKGIYEMFDSGIRCESIGNKQYIVAPDHLAIFESKDIKYDIVG